MRWQLGLALVVAHGHALAAAQDTCPTPQGRLIGVAPRVAVEVVEWSQSGEPLIFLSGLSKTAHAFDDFAPLLADRYRVIGLTRRGWGRSSPSPTGYDIGTLVGDIVAVMDSLAIPAAHVAGWSFGGDEGTLLAVRYPERVLSLTLLDSYDNSAAAGTFAGSDSLPGPSFPAAPAQPSRLRDVLRRQRMLFGHEDPVSEICASFHFSPTGELLSPVSPDSLGDMTSQGAARLAYSAVTQPVLAFYAVKREVKDLFPSVESMDSSSQARAAAVFEAVRREQLAARARLRRALPEARVEEIPGASHAVFRSHPERVYLAMRRFLADAVAPH